MSPSERAPSVGEAEQAPQRSYEDILTRRENKEQVTDTNTYHNTNGSSISWSGRVRCVLMYPRNDNHRRRFVLRRPIVRAARAARKVILNRQ